MATTKKRAEAEDAAADVDTAEEAAKVRAEAEEDEIDETVPGGRYKVDGKIVNADGEPVKK